ncbi:MAG: DUF928 domain-containing protein [Cyanobacteriota bacterium]|nr:DUF928 domain-containing protein [Cyanobacteriota bacterium]
MKSLNPLTPNTLLLLTLAGTIALGNLPQATIAQTPLDSPSIQFKPPQGDPAPRDSLGGGVRGNVPLLAPQNSARGDVVFRPLGNPTPRRTIGSGIRGEQLAEIVPVLPETQAGYTISPRPTIYLYVPPTAARRVFFSIQNENAESHYHATLNLSGGGGIVSVTLPENAPELETGKYYAWFFAPLNGDGILQPDTHSARGWIKRVEEPHNTGEMTSVAPLDRATLYAREGIWYDTLALLVSARHAQPDNETIARTWQDLLGQVGLDAIARWPLAEQL